MIPGARGCTPQTCSFRDHFAELEALGVDHLFGLSTQDPDYQREASERLRLRFAILSDERLELTTAMGLPTFETSGMTLLKRFTLVIDDGTVEHVFYPVFPPDRSASDVIDWLSQRSPAHHDHLPPQAFAEPAAHYQREKYRWQRCNVRPSSERRLVKGTEFRGSRSG